jgi:polysaccharide export outer membrane protein
MTRFLALFTFTAACALPALASAQDPKPLDNTATVASAALTTTPSVVEPAATSATATRAAATVNTAPISTPRLVDPDAFKIGPEDILDVQVWKNVDLSRVVPVRPDGMISLPLVNDIQAAGFTPGDLRQEITKRLTEFVPSPEVSVIVREVHSVKVAVLGAVRMPGHYEVKSPATVLEMIARAQGLNEFADRGRIVVLRQNGTSTSRIPFNYRKVAEGSEQDNFYVRPGDIIVVP